MWHIERNLSICPSVLVHHGAGLDLGLILLLLRPRCDPHVIRVRPGGDAPAEGHPVEAAGEEVGARVVRLGPRRAAHHPRVALPGTPRKGTLRQQVAFVFLLVDGVLGSGYGGAAQILTKLI